VGGTAFLAVGEGSILPGGIFAVDVRQPSQPQLLGFSSDTTNAVGVQIVNNYALVADSYSGLNILDMSVLMFPKLLGQYNAGAQNALLVCGNRAYVAGQWEVQQWDITSLPNARSLGSYYDSQTEWFERTAMVRSYAFVARDGSLGVDVFDTTDLTLSGQFSTDDGVFDLTVQGRNLYLAAGNSGVLVYDISYPSRPPAGRCRSYRLRRPLGCC